MNQHLSYQVIGCALAAILCVYTAHQLKDDRPGWWTAALYALGGLFVAATIGYYHRFSLPKNTVSGLKAAIALGACALSLWETGRALEKKALPKRYVKGVALALAVLSAASYTSFGDLGYSKFYHRWEFFHYYMGSKYDRELGYERLYQCAAVAQVDLGMGNEVKARKLRNLAEDVLEPTARTLEHPEECRDRFTPERWEQFKADVNFFRHTSNLQYWNDMQKDHGYNPPPVWTVTGHLLASLHPATERYCQILALIDPALFLAMFAAVWWAFGWRVFCVAVIFWGTQLPAEYFWTGGAFLRQDWLFYLVVSGCLLKKRRYTLAGAAIAYSTLLRVFPGPILAGPIMVAGWHLYRHRRFKKEHLRVAMGGVLATAILVGVSIGVAGTGSYKEFWRHINVHNSTPLTNNMGLRTMLSHSLSGRMKFTRDEKLMDPFFKWKQLRRERFAAFKPLYAVMVLAVMLGLAYVTRRIKTLWIAQSISLVAIISLVELTCYYYSMFILAAYLSRLRKEFEQGAFFVAGVSQLLVLNPVISYYYDDRYTAQSVLFFAYAVGIVIALWPRAKAAAAAAAGDAGKPAEPKAA